MVAHKVRERLTPLLGAAASGAAPLINGAVRGGTVLGVFSRAVIVGVPTESGPRVVSLLARGAASVPNGVRVAGAGADFAAVRVGAAALIGGGRVGIGAFDVRVVRTWSTHVQVIWPDVSGVATLAMRAAGNERGCPLEPINTLRVALATFVADDARDHDLGGAIGALVGLGRGLTPGGDDVLAGLLTGLHAVGRADVAATIGGLALHGITGRTTLLSADLLRLAAAGDACLEALAVLRAIHHPCLAGVGPGPGGSRISEAIDRLLSVGHTSGADLATGLAIGLMVGPGSDREAARTAAGQGAR